MLNKTKESMLVGKKKIFVIILLVGALGGWFWWHARVPKALWETVSVGRGDVLETVSVVGKLRPVEYADISFPTLGTVEKIFFEEGESVKRGDVIAVMNTDILQSELKQAVVALSIAEENEKLARRGWDDLKPEERAVKKLTTKQARENVRTVAAQIDEARAVAPLDGTVSQLDIRAGETVLAGKTIGRVSGPGNFIIEANVPEADIARVVPGKPATVVFDALSSDEKFEATVVSVDPSANVIQDVIYYTVTFSLENQDARLKEGMSADVDVRISERKDVLVVPYRALERDGNKTFVEVAKSATESARQPVTLGVEGDDGSVEITSGLAEGELVVVGRSKQ